MNAVGFMSPFVWFMTLPEVVLITVGTATAFSVLIGLLFVLRKWGLFN
jgi:hypothetical protein